MTHRFRTYENTIYVQQGRSGEWGAFARARGEGMILTGFDTRSQAILGMTLALQALNAYGPEKYHDMLPDEKEARVLYPVVDGLDEGKFI